MTTYRDKLIIFLLAFGGIRISELLHLHISDISLDKDGTAKIALVNPVEGKQFYTDNQKNKKKATRRQYLAEIYGLLPRNLLPPNNRLYLGWKGMEEDDSTNHISYVKWTRKEVGQAFYILHKEYLKEIASLGINTPYYFVALRGKTRGQPLSESGLRNHLANKVQQIGLDSSYFDINAHALRHFYGYYAANELGLSSDIVQAMMHHMEKSSTEIYYNLTNNTIQKELEKGYQKIKESSEFLLCLH